MFSMKYTSPKVTPKKGAPPAAMMALHPALPLLSPSSSLDRAGAIRGGTKSTENDHHGSCSVHAATGEGAMRGQHNLKHPKRNGASPSQSSSATKTKCSALLSKAREQSVISNSHDSENDSAVANIMEEEMDPVRSSLLALLDRECVSGSGSGDAEEGCSSSSIKLLPSSSSSSSDGDENSNSAASNGNVGWVEAAVAQVCIKGGKNDNADPVDEQIRENIKWEGNDNACPFDELIEGEDDDSCDQKDVIDDDDVKISQSVKPSSTSLPEGYSLHETEEDSFEYRRSSSMEASFDVQREELANSITTALSIGEDSVEVAPIAGLTCNLLLSSSSSGSEEEEAVNDSRAISPKIEKAADKCSNPSSPIIYDMSTQPASPFMSEVNGGGCGDEPTHNMGSTASNATESDIGGDAYFDGKDSLVKEKKMRADSIEDDLVHVTLPPRVNRTTTNGSVPEHDPFLPGCSSPPRASPGKSPFPKQTPLPVATPRQPFKHTHSLLDDCSDDEEETAAFMVVDSPTRHSHSYSCLPRARTNSEGSAPFSSYFKKQKPNRKRHNSIQFAGSSATQASINNIQHALLQTRHRRWDCQMAYAGPHAQSNQVFDVSNRFHTIVGYVPEIDDCEHMARLSVSGEAIRAAALASGLWRTVRLIRLPRGLFSSYSSEMERRKDGDDVWALLKMLNSTFPVLDQIDFGGDISRPSFGSNRISANSDDWRNEVLAYIMECLPNIVAIDGFVVEQEVPEAESRSSETAPASPKEAKDRQHDDSNTNSSPQLSQRETNTFETVENSTACVDCETVPPMCGFEDLVESEAIYGQWNTSTTMGDDDLNDSLYGTKVGAEETTEPGEHISSDGRVDASETVLTTEVQNEHEVLAIRCSGSQESIDGDMKKIQPLSSSSSALSSSRSWGSNGSGTRPPTCPNSTPRSRPSAKPAERKKGKGSFTKASGRLKRRVLELIPSVSMMDEEDDEESEDSEDNALENDLPTDLL